MLLYLVNFIGSFMPLSLITGMLSSLNKEAEGQKVCRHLILSLLAGLLSGLIIYFFSFRQGTVTAARTFLYASAALTALINAGVLMLPKKYKTVSVSFTAVLAAASTFSFLSFIAEQAISSISVLNTDFILNIGGILTGVCIIAFLIMLTAYISSENTRGIVLGFILFSSTLLIAQWSADALLGLIRLEIVGITSSRLSFIAKVAKYSRMTPYINLCIITALSILFFRRKRASVPYTGFSGARSEHRKALSRVLFETRCFKAAVTSACVILALLLYNDLYATRPPKISPPVNMKPDADGFIKVKIDAVRDGNLHRYSYITDDGHVVRFFLINRSKTQDRIAVVYDACMLCGDMGYIHRNNEVFCIACNVRIFIPSIGKAGGCNPIPLEHKVEEGYIVINADELDKGAKYFSETVSIKVKDPVTSKEMINLKAPYRYEYKGRTYFFESQEFADKFMASPERYIGAQEARYFRVQGFKE